MHAQFRTPADVTRPNEMFELRELLQFFRVRAKLSSKQLKAGVLNLEIWTRTDGAVSSYNICIIPLEYTLADRRIKNPFRDHQSGS